MSPTPEEPAATVTMKVAVDTVDAAISGELDMANADDIAASLLTACDRTRALVLDVTAVTFLDSHGISALYRLNEELAQAGRRLRVIAHSDSPVGRTLEISGMDKILTVVEPEQKQ